VNVRRADLLLLLAGIDIALTRELRARGRRRRIWHRTACTVGLKAELSHAERESMAMRLQLNALYQSASARESPAVAPTSSA
jgi:hypothetical protein